MSHSVLRLRFAHRLIAAALLCLSVAPFPARAETAAGIATWPQADSDLKPEAGIRFGVLGNGMRFAVMRNTTPAGQAAIRLRIGSGSLQEADDQQGLAHMLEHMAFKGSTRVPEGEMVRILQRKGLAFGADTNAHTSYDETVYALDLPEVDADTVSTGLMLMRETASELTLSASALDRERGVVLSEERLRDTPGYRGVMGLFNVLLAGQRVPERAPIGKTEIIRTAPIERLRAYYQANYRPDRATLLVVGDIDPAAMEAEIRRRFEDWKPVGPAVAEPDLGQPLKRGVGADVVKIPSANTKIYLSWIRPFDAAPDSYAKRRRTAIEYVGLSVLKRRLQALSRKANPPFIAADVGLQDLYESARASLLSADVEAGAWDKGLAALDQEQRRLLRFGTSQAEVDREVAEYRSALQSLSDGAATRTSPDLAAMLANSVDEAKVFTSPADDLALFERMVKGLTAAEVDKAVQAVFSGSGPRLVLQGAEPPEPAVVEKAYAQSQSVAVTAPADAAAVVWPYTNFGSPGTIVERRTVEDLGATMVRFANGVRLTVKPTKFRADEIQVRLDIGRGRLDLPHDRPVPTWTAQAVELSGLKAIDYDDMQKVLAPKIASIGFSLEDNAFKFEGTTRPADLATQLQIFAAYASDPAWRPEVFERIRQLYLANLPQYEATAGVVVSRDFQGLIHSGDPRWTFPDRPQLLAAKPDDFQALFSPVFARGALDITIVGDIGVDDAVREVAATFGALPPRPVLPAPVADGGGAFPAVTAEPVVHTHSGRPDNAAVLVAIPVGDMLSDIPRSFTADLASSILVNRLIDEFRIAEGATYSPQGSVDLSSSLPGFGYVYAMVETTPAKVASFYALVDKIAADLADKPVSADELARARAPKIETIRRRRQENDYWLGKLSGSQTDPRRLDLIRAGQDAYDKVGPEDIRAFAKTYFKPGSVWKLTVLPAGVAAAR